jgi:signal transduction histidine kinase
MLRRISTKLVLAVLLAVVLPFVAFAFYMNEQMEGRLTRHVAQQALLGLAKDLGGQADYFVEERRSDLEQWANAPWTKEALDNYVAERARRERAGNGEPGSEVPARAWDARALSRVVQREVTTETFALEFQRRRELTGEFDRYLELKKVYDLVLLVAADGRLVTTSSRLPGGAPFSEAFLEYLFAYDYARASWFAPARAGQFVRVDHHISPFHVELEAGESHDAALDYQLGFAAPVFDRDQPELVRGVLYGLVNWWYVQDLVSSQVIPNAFRGFFTEDRPPSPYGWLWMSDANTILAHKDRALYYRRVDEDLGLGQLVRAVRADPGGWGLYPEYTFLGERKNAAYRRCKSSAEGGFDWVIGVGINNDDIYATATELRRLLLGGTLGVLVLSVFLTLFIARRTTGPIRELQKRVRQVAEGDLDARVEIRSQDELGALSEDVNRMTRELKEQRARIVKAEKDAAWREMARQIAHDIKNPLTPITLSLDLLERARRERAAGSEEILERTMGLMRRQVEHLRQIANDFYEFTGGQKPVPRAVPLGVLLEEVMHLHDAWAVERRVTLHKDGPEARVWADLGKLRRVLVNLISNALQAMPEGGDLYVATRLLAGKVEVTIRDTGVGLSPEARAHLFEPYFTTKSEGTGLGLAIAKRALEEMGGEIELVPAEDGPGTVARLELVLAPAESA